MVYVTIYKPICGWKAVLMDSEEGPINTGFFSYDNPKEAIQDAKAWAEAEEIPYRPLNNDPFVDCT